MKRYRLTGQEQAPAERIVAVGRSRTAAERALVELAAATAFAALTAVGARVQIPLPFTPVPVTGQVFCVLLAGATLGWRLAFVSQVEYLAAGAAGLPVFAHGGGLAVVLGPTGGFLVGFPIAAAVVGYGREWRVESGERARALGLARVQLVLACLCGVVVVHAFGAGWYGVWGAFSAGAAKLPVVLAQAVYPFVLIDTVKAVAAAWIAPSVRRMVALPW